MYQTYSTLEEIEKVSIRTKRFFFLQFFFLIGIIGRFLYLQVFQRQYYSFLVEGNTEREIIETAARGEILDISGIPLTANRPMYQLTSIFPYVDSTRRKEIFEELALLIHTPIQHIEELYEKNKMFYRPIVVKETLSQEEIVALSEYAWKFPFLNINLYFGRYYPKPFANSHLLGYVGPASEEEMKNNPKLTGLSIVGKLGIEKFYDAILRGEDGTKVDLVNVYGERIQDMPEKEKVSVPGKTLKLHIDSELQELAYEALNHRNGVVIVSEAATGAVKSFVSSPGFDVNELMDPEKRNQAFVSLQKDKNKPFLNRAIRGLYAPGSLFKVLTSLVILDNKIIDPYQKLDTSQGYIVVNRRVFRDHKIHPSGNMPEAIRDSNNVYFYLLAKKMAPEMFAQAAEEYFLNKPSSIDLVGEITNPFPTPEWKKQRTGQPWYIGDTINVSIGQGYLLFTPIQMHQFLSLVANRGRLMRPQILKEILDPITQEVLEVQKPIVERDKDIPESIWKPLVEGLEQVSSQGTGLWHKYLSSLPIAGKTGSAQNSQGKAHAWFSSYGPTDKPITEQYVVTVLIENAGSGGGYAVPIASVIYNYLAGTSTKSEAINILRNIRR